MTTWSLPSSWPTTCSGKAFLPERITIALCITSDSAREIAGAREYLAQTPYRVPDGEIPFRASYKAAMDRGMAITEVRFPSLRKRADVMAQGIIDAVAAVADEGDGSG